MTNQKSAYIFICVAGFIIEVFLSMFLNLNGEAGNISLFMFIYLETFLIMLITFYLIKRLTKEPVQDQQETKKNESHFLSFFARLLSIEKEDSKKLKIPLLIILFGIIFRLTLFPTINTTSPDVSRYLWEGKILYHGYNPFILSPDDTQLAKFHNDLYDKVTYKDMPAIYPPVAQGAFVLAYLISGEALTGLKVIYLAFDLLIIFMILKLLYIKKIDLNNIILYAWMPLILLEYFVNTHLDLVGIFFMISFIFLMEKNKVIGASVFFTLAFLTKMYPIILLPLIFKKAGVRKSLYFLLIFLFLSLVIYIPFIYKDTSVFSSLSTYLQKWQFNSSVYYLLKYQLGNEQLARLLCSGGFIISVGIISFFYKDFLKASYTIFICLIIFSTTLYPWYLGWIASLNPFYNFYSVTSLLFSVNFSNFTPLGTVWKEYLFVLLIQYVPFYGLLIYDLWIIRRKKREELNVIKYS